MLHVNEPAPLLREASLGKQFPVELENIVQKLLKKAPSERYQNFDDVANDLTAVYSKGVPISTTTPQPQAKIVRESKKVNITVKQLSLYVALAMTVSSALTAGIIHTSKVFVVKNTTVQDSSQQPPEPGSVDQSRAPASPGTQASSSDAESDPMEGAIDRDSAAKTAFSKVGRISAEIVQSGKHKGQRKFVFPEVSMGYVVYRPNRRPAIRTQYFPPRVPLTFSIGAGDPAPFNNPEIFSKVNTNDFAGLKIRPPATAVVIGEVRVSVEKEAENLAAILSAFSKSKSVDTVGIELLGINKHSLAALDKMEALRSLDLFGTLAIDLGKEKHSAFQRVNSLCLTKPMSADLILRQIEGSNRLTALAVQQCGPLPPGFPSNLRDCSKLNYLAIENDVFADRWLKDLPQLHSLKTLYLNEMVATPHQLQQILDTCPQVENLVLAGNTADSLFRSGRFKNNPRVSFRGFE